MDLYLVENIMAKIPHGEDREELCDYTDYPNRRSCKLHNAKPDCIASATVDI